MNCQNCHIQPRYSKGRCEACYRYLRRNGFDRPLERITAAWELRAFPREYRRGKIA